jgi:hypothetical protein
MSIKSESIGSIQLGLDGRDEYLKLSETKAVLPYREVQDFFNRYYYRDTNQEAGGYFCHGFTWLPIRYLRNEGVLIVHHRYDV